MTPTQPNEDYDNFHDLDPNYNNVLLYNNNNENENASDDENSIANDTDDNHDQEDPVRIRVGGVDFVHSASWLQRVVVNSPVCVERLAGSCNETPPPPQHE